MKTYVPKQGEVARAWWVVDAEGMTLGRLASVVASRLRGKHKAVFTPYLDTGDHVVVVNAERVVLTGRKTSHKIYRHHSHYPGGLRELTASEMMRRYPTRIVEQAIKGMLPKGPLGRRMARKLKVYTGPTHPHVSQQPRALDIADARRAR